MHVSIKSFLKEWGLLILLTFLVYEEKKVILGFNEIEYVKQFM